MFVCLGYVRAPKRKRERKKERERKRERERRKESKGIAGSSVRIKILIYWLSIFLQGEAILIYEA